MKKSFILMCAALFALTSFVPAQAEELTVFGAGTATCEEVPIRGYWYDTQDYKVQTILPESEFANMIGASVTAMKFYIADAGGNKMSGGKLAVSIGTTDVSYFYQLSAEFITTGFTQVAEITMTQGETEIVIDFNEPWVYDGGNIMIETRVVEGGNCPDVKFLGEPSSVYNAVYGKSSATPTAFYPKTTFTYSGGIEDMAKVTPAAIEFGTVYLENTATQAITVKNLGKNAFTPVFSGLEAPFSIDAATEVAPGETKTFDVTFTASTIGEYNQTLIVNCGVAGLFEVPITGIAAEMPAEVVVAEGTATSNIVPIRTSDYEYYNGGNQAQMIYNSDLLTALQGKKINSIKFHASAPFQRLEGGKIQLSLKEDEQSAYESATAITDLTVVATGTVVLGESEIVFTFDEPYTYNGGNLVVETLVTEPGEYSFSDKFLGTNTTDYVSYAHFNSSGWESHVYKFLPMTTFGYVKEDTPEPQVIPGDANDDGHVTIGDVSALIDYLLHNPGANFNETNADVNQDGHITIGDVSAIIDKLLANN